MLCCGDDFRLESRRQFHALLRVLSFLALLVILRLELDDMFRTHYRAAVNLMRVEFNRGPLITR